MRHHFGAPLNEKYLYLLRVLAVLATAFLFSLLGLIAYLYVSSGSLESSVEQTLRAEVVESFPAAKMVTVLVPIQEIEAGAKLHPFMFRQESRPEVGVPDGAVDDFNLLESRYARGILFPGMPIVLSHTAIDKSPNEVVERIPPGFRAITIPHDSTRGSLFIGPGVQVDINWITRRNDELVAISLVQNVQVLAADARTEIAEESTDSAPSTVTLLLQTEDANKVQLARSSGTIYLSLRGDEDPEEVPQAPTKLPGSKNTPEKSHDTVIMDGVRYFYVNGKLVRADQFQDDMNF